MVKNTIHTFEKMNKDISESKNPSTFYYDAHNIRFITNKEVITGGFSFEKGNELVITIPTPVINADNHSIDYTTNNINKQLIYSITGSTIPRSEIETNYYDNSIFSFKQSGEQIILAAVTVRNNIIIFSTDNNGFDCIWKINDENYNLELIYIRDLKFNTTNPIQIINNFENEIIDKIYWVDGKEQMRFINLNHSIANGDLEELIDLNSSILNIVGEFTTTQPKIIAKIAGGIHTSGMIQYAYNLYKINSSQTKLSPLSELISLDKGNSGGGKVNEVVGTTPIVKIDTLDKDYTNIKLYAIKYTSYNTLPNISLIADRNIINLNEFIYYDDGNIISSLSLEDFLFLGSDIIIPKHINTKNNYMFLSNYKEKNFDLKLDTRAYSFPINSTTTTIYNSLITINGIDPISEEPTYTINDDIINAVTFVPEKYAAINKVLFGNIYQYNSSIIGGEGPYIKYKLKRAEIGIDDFTEKDSKLKFFKDRDLYRIAIQFYNKYNQLSLPKWIADFIVNTNEGFNLDGKYATLEVELKDNFYVWLNDNKNFLDENGNYDDSLKPVGYKILRGERTLLDRGILCQGLINGMMSNIANGRKQSTPFSADAILYANQGNKLPSLMRRFDDYLVPQYHAATYDKLDITDGLAHPNLRTDITTFDYNNDYWGAGREVFKTKGSDADYYISETFQFNQLMQMFSPEIEFNFIQNLSGVDLVVLGGLENDYNAYWGQQRTIDTRLTRVETKIFNAISPFDIKAEDPANEQDILGDPYELMNGGIFEQSNSADYMIFFQTYRRYTGNFNLSDISFTREKVYGNPEIVEKAQGKTDYNNNPDLTYYNSLEPMTADGERILAFVNSWGCRNITFALGEDNDLTKDRKPLEILFNQTGISDTGVGLIAEFKLPNILLYVGNFYGGNSYESKKATNYIEIGEYKEINININYIKNPGDTFVQNYRFTKIVKTDTEVYLDTSQQHTEIVEFRVETTVDLKNRSDKSLTNWDNTFQPRYDDYQNYNKVYSQDANLILRKDLNYNFKKVNNFDTAVISTKVKIPGELIDSWTDLQPNNVIYLDGKFGSINNLISFKDQLYTFQDKGIAQLSILPRVQVQGSDGIAVQLGTGEVLQRYDYLTTNSGSINKWGILPIESGIYYLDALNKTFNCLGEKFEGLSDKEGFHKYFLDNINLNAIKIDNPILHSGVSIGWDKITNDIYLTIFDENNKRITLAYNLMQQGFSSFYDYHSSIYIYNKGKLLTINPDINNTIYETFSGNYNTFYNNNKLSKIAFIVNPEPYVECTFNNLEYKSEALNNLNQEQKYTWERIKAYNEFQNSNSVNLVNNINKRLLNRKWRLNIPRDNNKVNRIRNTWSIIELESNNTDHLNYRNHDIITYYNPNNKTIS